MQLRKVTGSSGLNQLANEMTYRRYMTNRVSISKYFSYMTIPEYIVLCMAKEPGQPENSEARKVYLADIAERHADAGTSDFRPDRKTERQRIYHLDARWKRQ